MVAIKDYASEKYHSLRSLHEAHDLFLNANAEELVDTKICDLFVKHNLHNIYGVSLLHRHFDMSPEERLVESGNVSAPWSYHQPSSSLFGGSVVPRSWMYSSADRAFYPIEFGYNAQLQQTYPSTPPSDMANGTAFLDEFCTLLEQYNMTDILGLTTMSPNAPGTMKIEKTWGKTNVVFTVAEDESDVSSKETISAMWNFGAVQPSKRNNYRVMGCQSGCRCQ